jgi:5-methylcytosine-specific restriction endonuclease McrA
MSKNIFNIHLKSFSTLRTTTQSKKRQLTNAQKIFAWENYPHICHICNKKVTKFSDAEFDHTRAYANSGATNLSNIKIVHRLCNRLKGKKSLSETKKLLGIKIEHKKRATTKKKHIRQQNSSLFELPPLKMPKFKL